jgi:restriction endonuclease
MVNLLLALFAPMDFIKKKDFVKNLAEIISLKIKSLLIALNVMKNALNAQDLIFSIAFLAKMINSFSKINALIHAP